MPLLASLWPFRMIKSSVKQWITLVTLLEEEFLMFLTRKKVPTGYTRCTTTHFIHFKRINCSFLYACPYLTHTKLSIRRIDSRRSGIMMGLMIGLPLSIEGRTLGSIWSSGFHDLALARTPVTLSSKCPEVFNLTQENYAREGGLKNKIKMTQCD